VPFYLNVALSFLVALLWVERLKNRGYLFQHFLSWPLVILVAFQCFVLMPVQTFHFRFHHDWALAYLVDPDLHPSVDTLLTLWTLIAAVLTFAASIGAYAIGRIPFEKPKSKAPRYALMTAGAVTLLMLAVLWRELLSIGEYNEFFVGEAKFLLVTPTGVGGILELLACAAFLYYGPRLIERIPRESSNLG
jgi:hypothetical protein